MQLHTQLVRDEHGQLIEVCTLNGVKAVVVDDQGRIKTELPHDTDRSAAMALSDLMAEAIPEITLIDLSFEAPALHAIHTVGITAVSISPNGLRPIRAPPYLMV